MAAQVGGISPENPERPKPKDLWDKADILIKLFTGGLIVGLGLLINSAANRVTQATQKAQLAATMVDSLVKQDPGVKRDIVLTTLDATVGGDQPALVCALSLQIVRADFRISSTGAPSQPQAGQYDASEVATRVAKLHCPDQLNTLVKTLVNVPTENPQLSEANSQEQTRSYDSASSPLQSYVLPNIGRSVAYIQYRADWSDTGRLNWTGPHF